MLRRLCVGVKASKIVNVMAPYRACLFPGIAASLGAPTQDTVGEVLLSGYAALLPPDLSCVGLGWTQYMQYDGITGTGGCIQTAITHYI